MPKSSRFHNPSTNHRSPSSLHEISCMRNFTFLGNQRPKRYNGLSQPEKEGDYALYAHALHAAGLHAPPSRRRARRDARARAEGFRGPGGLPRHVHLSGVSEDQRPMDARPRFPHGLRGRRGRRRRVRARVPPHPRWRPHRLRAHRKRRGGHSRLHRRLPRAGDGRGRRSASGRPRQLRLPPGPLPRDRVLAGL